MSSAPSALTNPEVVAAGGQRWEGDVGPGMVTWDMGCLEAAPVSPCCAVPPVPPVTMLPP